MKKKHDEQAGPSQAPPDAAEKTPPVEIVDADAVGTGTTEAPAESVQALAQERDDLLARLQRVSADYLNYQKRVQRDIDGARTFANEELMKSLLGVLDDMERALAVGRESHDAADPFVAGMQLVHDKALETLGKFGLSVIEAEGRPFDPELHQALMQQPSADQPPGTVLQVASKGYRLKGRTIRPSGVIVSTAGEQGTGGK